MQSEDLFVTCGSWLLQILYRLIYIVSIRMFEGFAFSIATRARHRASQMCQPIKEAARKISASAQQTVRKISVTGQETVRKFSSAFVHKTVCSFNHFRSKLCFRIRHRGRMPVMKPRYTHYLQYTELSDLSRNKLTTLFAQPHCLLHLNVF